jgi:hypothetical protein
MPLGTPFPPGQHFPVAYDSDHGVFLLVVDNTRYAEDEKGRRKPTARARSSSTFVYDLGSNRCVRLPDADLQPMGMNYMMAYDPTTSFLPTGNHGGRRSGGHSGQISAREMRHGALRGRHLTMLLACSFLPYRRPRHAGLSPDTDCHVSRVSGDWQAER